jgi:predicted transcriptional regulator
MIYPDSLNGLSGSQIKVYVALASTLSDKRNLSIMADEPLAKRVGLKRERFNEAKQGLIDKGLIEDCGVTQYGSRVYKIYGVKNDLGLVSDEEWTEAAQIAGQNVPDVGQNVPITGQNVQDSGQNVPITGQNVQDSGQNVPKIDQSGTSRGQNVPITGQNVQDSGQNGNTYIQKTIDNRRETDQSLSGSPVQRIDLRQATLSVLNSSQNGLNNNEESHMKKCHALVDGDTNVYIELLESVGKGMYYSECMPQFEEVCNQHKSNGNKRAYSTVIQIIESSNIEAGCPNYLRDDLSKKKWMFIQRNHAPGKLNLFNSQLYSGNQEIIDQCIETYAQDMLKQHNNG